MCPGNCDTMQRPPVEDGGVSERWHACSGYLILTLHHISPHLPASPPTSTPGTMVRVTGVAPSHRCVVMMYNIPGSANTSHCYLLRFDRRCHNHAMLIVQCYWAQRDLRACIIRPCTIWALACDELHTARTPGIHQIHTLRSQAR